MNRKEKILSVIILAPILPLLSMIIFWWTSVIMRLGDQLITASFFVGLTVGVVLGCIFLKKMAKKFFSLSKLVAILIYLFYTIGIFGFFMGVPVFNLVLGPIAGWYAAVRIKVLKPEASESKKTIEKKKVLKFTSLIMVLICFSSGLLALTDKYTASNLEGMFGLGFDVTNGFLYILVFVGGIFLIGANYLLTGYFFSRYFKK